MYDHYDDLYSLRRDWRKSSWQAADPSDRRLRHVIYVDGRLVDTWAEPVHDSEWESYAHEFDLEKQPASTPPPAPCEPPHVAALRWLEGVVGGRDELMALDPAPPRAAERPSIDDSAMAAAYAEVEDHLARVSARFFDDEVDNLLAATLAAVWTRSPELVTGRASTEVAGGILWVVGRANNLFSGGLTQTTIRRELWCRGQLSTMGRTVAALLRGVDLWGSHRPPNAPALLSFANPDLLTSATRRTLIAWRDEALRAEGSPVLPQEVD